MNKPIRNLEYLNFCPVCGKKYDRFGVTVLEEKEGRATLHLHCAFCQASSLVFVIVNASGVLSLGMVTDVTGDEARRMLNREAISEDETLAIHERLKEIKNVEELI